MERPRLRWTLAGLAAAAILPLAAIACDDEDDDGDDLDVTSTISTTSPAATTTGTMTATATPTQADDDDDASPSPGPGGGDGQTGNDELDDIIAEVEGGDIDALVNRAELISLECSTAQGAGGPPPCEAGETEGTRVQVFPITTCQGEHVREANLAAVFEQHLADTNPRLYAVFETGDEGTDEFPRGEWAILFETEPDAGSSDSAGVILGVNEDGDIIDLYRGCDTTLEELYDSERDPDGEELVEPTS